jgi:hypothetical protein
MVKYIQDNIEGWQSTVIVSSDAGGVKRYVISLVVVNQIGDMTREFACAGVNFLQCSLESISVVYP